MSLDPHVRRFLDMMAVGGIRERTIAQRREAVSALSRFAAGQATAVDVQALSLPLPAGPTAARLYAPPGASAPGPALVFFHGGGLVTGDLDTHDAICRRLCLAAGMRVVAVAYRLAPEHPFPAAINDAVAAVAVLSGAAAKYGIDPERLAVGGDSAGAGLAARVCQEARSSGPAIAAQLLVCPVLDLTCSSDSYRAFASGYFLDDATVRQDIAASGVADAVADPRVSPLFETDLAGLPPAHIHTADHDVVRDDGAAYAAKLERAGVPVDYTCHAGMIHFFYGLGRLVPAAQTTLAEIGAAFGALLRGETTAAHTEPTLQRRVS